MSELAERVAALAVRSRAKNAERRERIKAEVAAHAEAVEVKRVEFRAAMPVIAGVVDQLRECFGEVRVLAAREGGQAVVNRRACERFAVDVARYER